MVFMVSYSRHNLKKTEELLSDLGYKVRYEKGQFKSGYCIVDSASVIIVNKFLDVTSRMQKLLEILEGMELSVDDLNARQKKIYRQIFKKLYSELDNQTTSSEA